MALQPGMVSNQPSACHRSHVAASTCPSSVHLLACPSRRKKGAYHRLTLNEISQLRQGRGMRWRRSGMATSCCSPAPTPPGCQPCSWPRDGPASWGSAGAAQPYRVCHSSSAYMNFTCSAPGVNHFVSTHVLPEHRLTQTLSHVYPPTLTLIPIRGLEKLPSIHTCLPLLT